MDRYNKRYTTIALFYFFVAAALGLLLRLFPIIDVDATYRYIVHTHSHIALIGWVYGALTVLIYQLLIEKTEKNKKKFKLLFFFTQITILGMLISFPIKGYALFSIVFSTLFLIASYWFYVFYKKSVKIPAISMYANKFIHASLLFMLLSSIGPWTLGIIMNTLGSSSPWYKNAIYFYLHFQYNGWFLFCLIGLFFLLVAHLKISLSNKQLRAIYKLFTLSCFFTFFLSVLWMQPHPIIYIFAGFGAVTQAIALIKLIQITVSIKTLLRQKLSPIIYQSLYLALVLLVLKITLQTLSAIPFFATLASQVISFVIAYLHLVFLGVVSLSLFAFLSFFKLIKLPTFWVYIYLNGFVSSEILIIYNGIATWKQFPNIDNYFFYLVVFSALMFIGLLGILIPNLKTIFSTQKESLLQK
ncbi:MAG: hypothetical protein P8K77_00075 [Polaribacter sp.]|nr:hypothetical protein [Polaribacter sp.]